MIKLWIDDVRLAPSGYIRFRSVNEAINFINQRVDENNILNIDEFDLDHDAGDFRHYGGDYIKILEYLEECQMVKNWHIDSIFKFHSMNPVGVQNMKRICMINGWRVE